MRCKHCNEQFERLKFNQKYCLKTECVNVWIESEKDKQWAKRKKALKTNLETNIELGEITYRAMEIVKKIKQGNTTTYNRYKIK